VLHYLNISWSNRRQSSPRGGLSSDNVDI
jgi:hypothetical protein